MDFNLPNISQYLTSNTWQIADVVFLAGFLYNVVVHFNIGLTGTLFRFLGHIAAYFIARWLTQQSIVYLGIKDQSSLLIIGVVMFILFSYILYKQLKYFTPGPLAFIDSLLGACYGVIEVGIFIIIVNTIAIYVHQNGFHIPEWILVANGKNKEPPKLEKPEILFRILKLGEEKAHNLIILPSEYVSTAFNWIKNQLPTPPEDTPKTVTIKNDTYKT